MRPIQKLLDVMAALRDPDTGCPWDQQQDFASIAPYTIEEAYEVADAIDRGDLNSLRDELGDLLLQVVYHSQMASELGAFDFATVAAGITDKMIDRHPHVFAKTTVADAAAQSEAWESLKQAERAASGSHGVLDDVSLALPALLRAQKLGKRAARVGFDFADAQAARAKILEELGELDEASLTENPQAVAEEMGDLLFAVTNLARKLAVNPEEALRAANHKFSARFRCVEQAVNDAGGDWTAFSAEQLEAFWDAAKLSAPG